MNIHCNRYSYNYNMNGVHQRTMVKAYGILFEIVVTGKAGRADFVTTVLKIGASVALFGLVR